MEINQSLPTLSNGLDDRYERMHMIFINDSFSSLLSMYEQFNLNTQYTYNYLFLFSRVCSRIPYGIRGVKMPVGLYSAIQLYNGL